MFAPFVDCSSHLWILLLLFFQVYIGVVIVVVVYDTIRNRFVSACDEAVSVMFQGLAFGGWRPGLGDADAEARVTDGV